jgi:hypothetical protein
VTFVPESLNPPGYPTEWEADVLLADGGVARLRPIRPDDADLLVQRPMEPLFGMPEVSATGNHGTVFNSGVMVVEPCNCTFRLLMDHIGDIQSYNGGDQGYLNEVFSWWHRLPSHANYMKHFWEGNSAEHAAAKRRVLAADPPVALAVHFVGMKPWF